MNNIEMPTATKPKSVIIDGELHGKFKLLCKGKSGVIEDLIELYLGDPRGIQKVIDERKEQSNHI